MIFCKAVNWVKYVPFSGWLVRLIPLGLSTAKLPIQPNTAVNPATDIVKTSVFESEDKKL